MTEAGPVRSRSLVAKLALATLLAALALSLLASAYVIAADSRAFHADTLEQIDRLQRLVAPPAAEAAYQLNADQAESLVAGLQAFDEIHRAEILDDFGRTLAEVEREGGGASWLGERLFGDDRRHERELIHPDLREANGAVGTLRVELAPDVLGAALVERLRNSVVTSVVQAVIVSLVVVLLFYGLMLRPMLRIF